MTPTKAEFAIQLANRQSKLSAATNATTRAKAAHTLIPKALLAKVSTRSLMPYWVLTEQPTAANTARSIAPWATQRRRTNRNMKAIGPWAYRPISLIAVTISLPFAITAACVHKGPMEVLEILETQGDGTLAVWQAALDLLRTPVYRH